MHDPSSAAYYQAMMMKQPEFPEQEQLKCPRCDSPNTKFCYYNNYNLSQPRHFCKSCRRYWTKGGALRNIPVGGGSRKNTKRSAHAPSSSGLQKKNHIVRNPDPDPDPNRISAFHDPASSSTASESLQSGSNPAARFSVVSGQVQDPTRIYGFPIGDQDMKAALDIGGSFSSLLASNMQLGGILDGLNENGSGPDPGTGLRSGDAANGGGEEAGCWSGWTNLSMNSGGSGSSLH